MPRLMQSLFISAALAVSPMLVLSQPALAQESAKSATFSQQELEQLLAPIALYPDALLAQVLMASTYPLEVVQAARWRKDNPKLKDKALEDALQKQPWDASVKSLTAFPDVLTMMNDKIDWTQKLGDAFLAQQKDVMETTQRLRAKAEAAGNLKTTKEQKVVVEQATTTTIYRIEPQSEVIYVPVYNPTIVYGPWPYPRYTPYYWYPPTYTYPSSAFGFTVGIFVGAAIWGGCDWHHHDIDIDINRYNSFNRTTINTKDWKHNPEHRRGVEYRDQQTREQYRPSAKTQEQQRDAFRGKAESSRTDLNNIDRSALQNQMQEVDRAELANRAKNVDRAAVQDKAGKIEAKPANRTSASKISSKGTAERSAKPSVNAFSHADQGTVNRAASNRGSSSQRSAARPIRTSRAR